MLHAGGRGTAEAIDTTVAMGSSIANALGMAKAECETKPIVATIGDSLSSILEFLPIDAVYNQANITVLLLDNQIVAMTRQDHRDRETLRGEETVRIDYAEMAKACGVKWSVPSTPTMWRQCSKTSGKPSIIRVSMLISNRPCVLDPVKIKGEPLRIDAASCTGCQSRRTSAVRPSAGAVNSMRGITKSGSTRLPASAVPSVPRCARRTASGLFCRRPHDSFNDYCCRSHPGAGITSGAGSQQKEPVNVLIVESGVRG